MEQGRFGSKAHALAYLMGVYLSDGCITGNGFSMDVRDCDFRDEVASAFDVVGANYSTRLSKLGFYWASERAPYRVAKRLRQVFPSGRDHLPAVPAPLHFDLIAGIMDGDGSICYLSRGTYQLRVYGWSKYLAGMQTLLGGHDVWMRYRPTEGKHYISKESFVRAGFYFRMPRKQELLWEYVESRGLPYAEAI